MNPNSNQDGSPCTVQTVGSPDCQPSSSTSTATSRSYDDYHNHKVDPPNQHNSSSQEPSRQNYSSGGADDDSAGKGESKVKEILVSLPIAPDFIRSSAAQAVREYFPSSSAQPLSPEAVNTIIETAARLYFVSHGETPRAGALLSILERAQYEECKVIQLFEALCGEWGGMDKLPYFKALREERSPASGGEHGGSNLSSSGPLSSSDTERGERDQASGMNGVDDVVVMTDGMSLDEAASGNLEFITGAAWNGMGSGGITTSLPDSESERVAGAGASVSIMHGDQSGQTSGQIGGDEMDIRAVTLRAMKREAEYLTKKLTCAICLKERAEVTFLPCGHFVTCKSCASPCHVCPLCKQKVLAEVSTFLS